MKCITFDVTNTLIKVTGSVGQQYSKILFEKFNYRLDEEFTNSKFKRLFLDQNKKLPSFGYRSGISSKTWWSEIVKQLIKENSLLSTKYIHNEDELNKMSSVLFDEFSKGSYWTKFDHCDTVLLDLKKCGYKLGIISNFDERLIKIISDLNLLKYFDFLCFPANTNGYSKPEKEIFLKAFELSGLELRSYLMHVGDDYDLDYKPAVDLGFKSLLMNHKKKIPNNLKQDQYANNLIDLKDKIFMSFKY